MISQLPLNVSYQQPIKLIQYKNKHIPTISSIKFHSYPMITHNKQQEPGFGTAGIDKMVILELNH